MRTFFLLAMAAASAAFSGAASAQCVGNCGITPATDGVVTGSHRWISTNLGVSLAGLGLGGETNGSTLTTASFFANGTDKLSFEFNYVTSDGAGFADYAWVELLNGPMSLILFTARTTETGDTVPGFGLPGLAPGVSLTPAATPIIPGGPVWSPLGGFSGSCFSVGCGYTGWIKMTYTPAAGTYQLRFGVVNWADTIYDSGLAFRGLTIGTDPIVPIPEPGTWAMLIAGFGLLGLTLRRRRLAAVA